MLNQTAVEGLIESPPVREHKPDSKLIVKFKIICERDGRYYEDAAPHDVIDCIAWGDVGLYIYHHYSQGSQIAVSGRLQTTEGFDKKKGYWKKDTVLSVDRIYPVGEIKSLDEVPDYEPSIVEVEAQEKLPF